MPHWLSCALSDRNMTVDCPSGPLFIYQVVYTILNKTSLEQLSNESIAYNKYIVISWHNTGLTNITRNALKEFDSINGIRWLSLNMIVEIYPGTFDGLVNLGYLDLGHNSIVEIQRGRGDLMDSSIFEL